MCFFRYLALVSAACALTGCSSGPTTQVLNTYVLGEKVLLGRLNYTFFETQWLTQLGEGPTARVPQQRFSLIRFSATNGGSGDAPIPNMVLVADDGKQYEELPNGDGVPQWAGYLRNAKAADTVQGNIMFDAPPAHYKLKIADETGAKFALIDLPLSYGAETPEVVSPGEKKQ